MTFMKGKLVKCNHFYALQIDSDIIAVSLDKETEEHTVNYKHSLSLKNCQAIELGYDLDELALKESENLPPDSATDLEKFHLRIGFVRGAKAILEILGDKKFSEEDISKAYQEGYYDELSLQEVIQSLQKTEWDVEVVMDKIPADLAPGGWDVFPKLDAQNCIILKRVE